MRPFRLGGVSSPRYIVLHHTAIQKAEQLHSIDLSHQRRGYHKSKLGFNVAYHYVVGRDGTVVQTRYDDEPGPHTSDEYINWSSIGIVVTGNLTESPPTVSQITELQFLIRRLQSKHGIPDERVLLHSEIIGEARERTWYRQEMPSATACPGIDLRKLIYVKPDHLIKM